MLSCNDDELHSCLLYTTIFEFPQLFSASACSAFSENLCPPFDSKFHADAIPEASLPEHIDSLFIVKHSCLTLSYLFQVLDRSPDRKIPPSIIKI